MQPAILAGTPLFSPIRKLTAAGEILRSQISQMVAAAQFAADRYEDLCGRNVDHRGCMPFSAGRCNLWFQIRDSA